MNMFDSCSQMRSSCKCPIGFVHLFLGTAVPEFNWGGDEDAFFLYYLFEYKADNTIEYKGVARGSWGARDPPPPL